MRRLTPDGRDNPKRRVPLVGLQREISNAPWDWVLPPATNHSVAYEPIGTILSLESTIIADTWGCTRPTVSVRLIMGSSGTV